MIFNRFSVLQALFPAAPGNGPSDRQLQQAARAAAADAAQRWSLAAGRCPELATDLIGMGGVLSLHPVLIQEGCAVPEPFDPQRLAYEAGRRDMALQLLALMGITREEMAKLMEVAE